MNITLIGMSGVGKSSVGKILAKRLSYTFVDLDTVIQQQTGITPLQKVLDTLGEEKFLKREEEAIFAYQKCTDTVLAPGGSIVYSRRAMDLLKKISLVVFLDAPLESILRRVADYDKRAIVGLKNREVSALYAERLTLYRSYADLTIRMPNTLGRNIRRIVETICKKATRDTSSQRHGLSGTMTP